MNLRRLAGRLPAPRFVLATADRFIVASGLAEQRSGSSFDVADAAWRDGRLWVLRAPFDARRAWAGLERVSVWRPRSAFVLDAGGVKHIDADGRVADVDVVVPPDFASGNEPCADANAETVVDDAADRSAYLSAVRAALGHIAAGRVQKLVIARRARLLLRARPSFEALVEALVEGFCATGSSVYALENDDADLFVGASPEQLLRRHGDDVEVDAVAGTRVLAEAAALLESDKDRREHQLVTEGIASALAPLTSSMELSSQRLVERGGLAHLACQVRACATGSLSALLTALHPTAATAGSPVSPALDLLREIEGFDRGDYGGVVGVVDAQRAVVAVCLRGARISPDEAWVYAGAGVVDGSDPAAEWHETSHKARVLLHALTQAQIS